ncbi:MAG: hypothetical protein NUV44_07635 [Candidatus Scalindua sp.]|nr:hypothetical protein [Candidatus Scalindua sp.]
MKIYKIRAARTDQSMRAMTFNEYPELESSRKRGIYPYFRKESSTKTVPNFCLTPDTTEM